MAAARSHGGRHGPLLRFAVTIAVKDGRGVVVTVVMMAVDDDDDDDCCCVALP